MRIIKFQKVAKSVGALMAAAALVAGCAGNSASSGVRDDIATASDESDARKRARIRLELASGYFEQERIDVALDELKQAIAADPGFADAYNLRGLIYMRLNENSLAEDSFRRALVLAPGDGFIAHNYGWFLCQLRRFGPAREQFAAALAGRNYSEPAKTYMAMAMCAQADGRQAEAEQNFLRSYELDAANPIVGYNLAQLNFDRGNLGRSQFYVKRINATEFANAQTLWLGVKIERKLGNRDSYRSLADQLQRRFSDSQEARKYERGQFDD